MFKEVDYHKHFVIGTPLVGWKADKKEDRSWLENATSIIERFPNVKFFAALELDHRGLDPFSYVIEQLSIIKGEYWTYTINDNESKVTYSNRWIRIETGRNLIREFAQRNVKPFGNNWGEDASKVNKNVIKNEAVLYVDSDMIVNVPIIEKLFEVDRPLVSVNVPAYGLKGKVISNSPRIEEHWNTAGMLLVNAPAFYDLPWYHNNLLNLSDDPTFQHLAERLPHGQTWVRKDISADHKGQLLPVESRKIPDRMI
ncbi:MAG: hypothetical protein ACO295_05280 [Sediminibacterium sp.]